MNHQLSKLFTTQFFIGLSVGFFLVIVMIAAFIVVTVISTSNIM